MRVRGRNRLSFSPSSELLEGWLGRHTINIVHRSWQGAGAATQWQFHRVSWSLHLQSFRDVDRRQAQYCCVMLLQQKIVKYKYGGYMEYVYAVVWWVQVNSSSLREALSEGRACRSRGQSCNSGRSSQVIAL